MELIIVLILMCVFGALHTGAAHHAAPSAVARNGCSSLLLVILIALVALIVWGAVSVGGL